MAYKNLHLNPVLVLDGEMASSLAIVRSLGRKGARVTVGSSKTNSLSSLSRYCSSYFVYPNPLVDVPGFRKILIEQLKRHSYSLVIPVTDLTICPLMEIRKSVEALSRLAMPSNEALAVALSKSRTCDLARTLRIPIPKTMVIRNIEDFHGMQDQIKYPVVIKADRSKAWPSNSPGQDISVAYALDPKELNLRVRHLLALGPVILQEHVRGDGIGMGVLASRGETLFTFQYRRLHEVPLTGGGSSYRVSEPIDPKLNYYTSSLLKALCWDGVAMVEFKMDRKTGKTYLMEINGRFWGSLPLAVAAGADFPSYLLDLLVQQSKKFPATYKVGLRCSQLSREVEWLKEGLVTKRGMNEWARVPSYRTIIFDSCRLLNPSECFDTLDFWDPRPGINTIRRIAQQTVKDGWNKLLYLREKQRMRRIQHHP